MDRKYCVLLYSNHSPASSSLLNYINELPLDFPKVTGMTLLCIDNDSFKSIIQQNGIEYVPTLLVEYYGNTPKQKFEREYIYMWIDQIMNVLNSTETSKEESQSVRRTNITDGRDNVRDNVKDNVRDNVRDNVIDTEKPKPSLNVTTLAQQMAKDRESYISDTTHEHKKKT